MLVGAFETDWQVDLILLGGDLFHEIHPSRSSLFKCMSLLKKYCFGQDAVAFQMLSDSKDIFHSSNGYVNYEDPNVNIKLPVFSIHGNHDEPTGEQGATLAALDLLSVSSLVNYFGKVESLEGFTVKPILLQKGDTKVALYGIGYTSDERLHRTWVDSKVKFVQSEADMDDWFNVLVLHQNR